MLSLLFFLPTVFSLSLEWQVATDGTYSLAVDTVPWYTSPSLTLDPPTLCIAGSPVSLKATGPPTPASGTDTFGDWAGVSYQLTTSSPPVTTVTHTFKSYASNPTLLVATASFPDGVDTESGQTCGGTGDTRTSFPQWNTSDAYAPTLGVFSWKGSTMDTTPANVGLASLTTALDSAAVVSFFKGRPGVPHPTLVFSTLTSHKIIVQKMAVTGPATPGPLTSLWSSSRSDQVACLSTLCLDDQKPQGGYTPARVEGYGLVALGGDGVPGQACLNGAQFPVTPLLFSWSEAHGDNFVGPNGNPPGGAAWDPSSYATMGGNGWVVAASTGGSVAGTIPLYAYNRTYDAQHWDFAAVASPQGIAWATAAGYTRSILLGYVFSQPPTPCGGAGGGAGGTFTMGLSAAVSSIPAGWEYSTLFSVAEGGPTAAVYAWGNALQTYYSTSRIPSVTLTDLGYYSDDGAYYYVWEAYNIPARPWPAEVGMVLVKEDLWARGVPVAYMQLDDWWYTGEFYFGNVKSVTDWHASNASRLFPSGLPAFADTLNLPLQLYTPFWADNYQTPYNMTESTVFKGTKLVVPADSHAFFADLFDLGNEQTGGRFKAYEIDFLDSNFQGSASMFEDVHAADTWYEGMARAALERGIAIQYCLPSATDMMQALALPAVVQARASGDYVGKVNNPLTLGGSSLLMGALAIAPSKDTLWTASPQPGTMSDMEHNGLSYTTQPHVALDAVLATLSLGPVGISDGLGQVGVGLISQAFRCANDSTLLRPSRPLSWVDSVWVNKTFGGGAAVGGGVVDVRSTHASLPTTPSSSHAPTQNYHTLLAWRSTGDVVLGVTDLYPPPSDPNAPLATRLHDTLGVASNPGSAQQGCVDGAPAVPSCVTVVPGGLAGGGLILPASGGDLMNFTLMAVYEPMANGAWFLGELAKFVHVSPQRFDYVGVGGGGVAGIQVAVRGTPGESITLTAVDANATVRVKSVVIPAGGLMEVDF